MYDSWLGLGFQTRWGHSEVRMLTRDRKAWETGAHKAMGGRRDWGWAFPRRTEPGQVRGFLLRVRGRGGEQSSSPRLGRDTQRDRSDGKDVLRPPEHFLVHQDGSRKLTSH